MKCESMLLQLLEAEPDELRRLVDTPVTRHLASCPRCTAVAERLIADTAQLAFALRADAVAVKPERRVPRWWLVPGVATAALALLLWRGDTPPVVQQPPTVAATAAPLVAPPVVVAEVPRSGQVNAPRTLTPRSVRIRPEPQLVAFRVEPVLIEPEPAPTPVIVTPLPRSTGARASDARGAVIVEPPPTKRATILRSAVPGVTVIWLN